MAWKRGCRLLGCGRSFSSIEKRILPDWSYRKRTDFTVRGEHVGMYTVIQHRNVFGGSLRGGLSRCLFSAGSELHLDEGGMYRHSGRRTYILSSFIGLHRCPRGQISPESGPHSKESPGSARVPAWHLVVCPDLMYCLRCAVTPMFYFSNEGPT